MAFFFFFCFIDGLGVGFFFLLALVADRCLVDTTMVRTARLFSREEAWWKEPLEGDMVALHFIVFLAKGFQSHGRGRYDDQDALHHYVKTLALLQRRVANPQDKRHTSDKTLDVVVGLAAMSSFKDETTMATKHLEGLYKMVALRGGIRTLDRKLLFKIC